MRASENAVTLPTIDGIAREGSGRSVGSDEKDRDSRPLESQLNRVFCGIYRQVVRAWREERKLQAFHRVLEEDARQRAEAVRIKAERDKAIAEKRARRRRLASEANRWAHSMRIRDYVEHIRRSAAGRQNTLAEINEWAEWALTIAAEIDPTGARLSPAT